MGWICLWSLEEEEEEEAAGGSSGIGEMAGDAEGTGGNEAVTSRLSMDIPGVHRAQMI